MRGQGVFPVAALAAVLVLGVSGAYAFVPIDLDTTVHWGACDVFSRTPQAFQYTVARSIRDYAAPRLSSRLPWGLEIGYHSDDYFGTDDETWTGLLAYERPVNNWGWGLQVPEQYTDRSGFGSLWYEGLTGYAYYDLDTYARVGGFGHLNYGFSDVVGIEDELSYGGGLFGSYRFSLTDTVWLTPTGVFTYYSPGQENWDESTILSLGGRLDYAAAANLGLWAQMHYNADTSNDTVDDSYWDWKLGLNYMVNDTLEIGGGFGTTESFEGFERMTIQFTVKMTY